MKNLVYSIMLLLFVCSCEFQPDGTFEPDNINMEITPPNIEIVSINVEGNTIYMKNTSRLDYKFRSDNQPIKYVNFYSNGLLAETINGSEGTFFIWESDFPNKNNTLLIEVITGSGTGSMIEEMGGEVFIIPFKEWEVKP